MTLFNEKWNFQRISLLLYTLLEITNGIQHQTKLDKMMAKQNLIHQEKQKKIETEWQKYAKI